MKIKLYTTRNNLTLYVFFSIDHMAILEDNDPVRATIWPPVEIVALIMALHHGMVSNKFGKKNLIFFFWREIKWIM